MFERYLPELRRRSQTQNAPMTIADLMEDFWKAPFAEFTRRPDGGVAYPALNISEGEKEVTVTAEVPGMEAKDIDVSIERGVLTIKGEKKFEEEEKKDNFHRIERSYGSFQRAVALPSEVDDANVQASYKDGVLKLVLPKAATAQRRKIEVSA